MILDTFPSAAEFYQTYWNKKPFVVRGAVPEWAFYTLIDGDTLAGLSLEDDIKSRLILTHENGDPYTCEHGPFADDRFESLGTKNWSLLVQNVEQYHTDTAQLLQHFSFAPRWLMDDIMVSYSAPSGGVGPHTDSYHVFLVQGIGVRTWRIGNASITSEDLIEGLDLKVLKNGVDGDEFTVRMGDVIYIPPHFAHEGITVENAMTFSVGFLGPKLSDLMIEYGHFLAQNEDTDMRYSGQNLSAKSAGLTIDKLTQTTLQTLLTDAISGDDFSKWLVTYFSAPTHDASAAPVREISPKSLYAHLENTRTLYRPAHIKLTMTSDIKDVHVSAYGEHILTLDHDHIVVQWLRDNTDITQKDVKNSTPILCILADLYAQNILFFDDEDINA